MTRSRLVVVAMAGAALVAAASFGGLRAAPSPHAGMQVGAADLAGVVSGPNGPEAGVWVIAETRDLPTPFAKIVVTDDRGRYVVPQLPKAQYRVWARGYGLTDSAQTTARPGTFVDLRANAAPSAAAAAAHYPAIYWFAMLGVPPASAFSADGKSNGEGIGSGIHSQGRWLDVVKTDGCYTCHQLGNLATRTIPKSIAIAGASSTSWARRVQSGQAAGIMTRNIGLLGPHSLAAFGDWTDRVAKGELPFAQPQRPQGVERNVVITEWDWASPTTYLHDSIATDKRDPTRNANGKIYGSPEESTDEVPVLDPVRNAVSAVKAQLLDPATPSFSGTALEKPMQPSPYWGDERIWSSRTSIHNPMLDERGRLWLTARIRPPKNPAYCTDGSIPSSKLYPRETAGRQAEMYDPATGRWALANLCFGTHHLVFAPDKDDTLYFSAGGGNANVLGWLNAREFLATGDAAKAQGWTALVLDTNGDGKRNAGDTRIDADFYGIGVAPDGAVWGSVLGYPGRIVRVALGASPPETALAEVYDVPLDRGFSPRGLDVDGNGVVWVPLASGHLASFDRRRCRGPLNGPNATGKQCPEGWTLYPFPGPQFKGVSGSGSAEAAYYVWSDTFDTFGLGKNVPIATGNANEALLALVDGKMLTFRVPYPLGFFAKNVDGRIDDPKAGWKGRGLWTTFGSRTPWHMETGKGTRPKVYRFQLRPDPLAD